MAHALVRAEPALVPALGRGAEEVNAVHELSIATCIVEMAEAEAELRGVRILAIHLRIGPLAGVVKEALVPAYALAVEGTSLEGSRLVVEEAPGEELLVTALEVG